MASLSGYPTGQWTAADLAACRAGATFEVDVPYADRFSSASWSLDERRQPFGQATITRLTTDRGANFAPGMLFSPTVGISVNGKPVFAGFGESTDDKGTGVVVETWTNGDGLFDLPLAADYDVPDTYTHPKQVAASAAFSAISQEPYTGYPTDMPTSGQLSAFRALDFAAGDSIGDTLRTAAAALGMRVRVDHLLRHDSVHSPGTMYPSVTLAYAPLNWSYNATLAPTILPSDIIEYSRRGDSSEFATDLRLTAQWTESGAQKSSTYIYSVSDPGMLARVVKDITVNVRPPLVSGVRKLTSTYPLGVAYAAAYYRRQWVVTAQVAGWWWLEPGASLNIVNPRSGVVDQGIVQAVTFTSEGLTTITLRPA